MFLVFVLLMFAFVFSPGALFLHLRAVRCPFLCLPFCVCVRFVFVASWLARFWFRLHCFFVHCCWSGAFCLRFAFLFAVWALLFCEFRCMFFASWRFFWYVFEVRVMFLHLFDPMAVNICLPFCISVVVFRAYLIIVVCVCCGFDYFVLHVVAPFKLGLLDFYARPRLLLFCVVCL